MFRALDGTRDCCFFGGISGPSPCVEELCRLANLADVMCVGSNPSSPKFVFGSFFLGFFMGI